MVQALYAFIFFVIFGGHYNDTKSCNSGHPNRRNGQSTPSIAVVAESGGMRWVAVGGMLAALHHLGVSADIMVGTSGGGMALLYYAARNTPADVSVLNHLGSAGYNRQGGSRFLNMRNLISKQPVMDLNGLIHDAFTKRVPVKWDNLAKSKTPFYLTATTSRGEAKLLPAFNQPVATIKENATHSSRVPCIAHSVSDDSVLWDGVLSEALPIQSAFKLNAQRVIALRTCTKGTQKSDSLFTKHVVVPMIARRSKTIADLYSTRHKRTEQQLAPYWDDPNVLMIHCSEMLVGNLTTNTAKLWRQVYLGWDAVFLALGLPIAAYPKSWPTLAA